MSSVAPLAGRLSQLFSPRNCIVVSSVIFSIGTFLTSQAPSLAVFLAGRVLTGVGGAGILTIAIILVLELTGKKRRGLFIGMINAGYTSGVALGAVISGALLPVTGWVSFYLQFSLPATNTFRDLYSGPKPPLLSLLALGSSLAFHQTLFRVPGATRRNRYLRNWQALIMLVQ
jgi:MFS family permease